MKQTQKAFTLFENFIKPINSHTTPFSLSESENITTTKDFSGEFSIEIDGTTLKGFFSCTDNEITGNVFVKALPGTLLPLETKGSFCLDAELSGFLSNPILYARIDPSGLQITDGNFAKFNPQIDPITIVVAGGQISTQGHVHLHGCADVNYHIKLPIEFSLASKTFQLKPNAPLEGSVSSQGEIGPILHKLLDRPTSLSGNVNMKLTLGGTLEDPKAVGFCKLTEGSYEIPEIGVLLEHLSASVEVNGSHLIFNEIIASDGKAGKIYGNGFYFIDKEQNYPFGLALTLQDAALLNQDYIKIVCDGPLNFKGNKNEGMLNGQLQTSYAIISIPERSGTTINTVDVTFVNVPEKMTIAQSLSGSKSSWPLTLDINLQVPRTLGIEGKDLSSIWRGEVNVRGTANTPLLYGELKISEGQYLFNGNPFNISQATVMFAGDIEKKTTMYAIANKDLDKVKVDVIAKGPIKNPEISFRSNPPLPQREILSWLLFNRGTSEISPFQGAQLSESITNLSTNQQGPDVLSKIRSTFKIDRFEIGRNQNDDGSGVNLEVGKYISDNVLISVIKSDVNKIAVEANLTDKIKLQAQVGDDSQGKLMLRWKKDY